MNGTGGVQITPHRTHACAHFCRCVPPLHFVHFIQCTCIGSRYLSDPVCFSKVIPSATMSLLGVLEFTPFPLVFTSSTSTPTSLTGIRLNPCATPLWGGPSGDLADPILLQTHDLGHHFGPSCVRPKHKNDLSLNLFSKPLPLAAFFRTILLCSGGVTLDRTTRGACSPGGCKTSPPLRQPTCKPTLF